MTLKLYFLQSFVHLKLLNFESKIKKLKTSLFLLKGITNPKVDHFHLRPLICGKLFQFHSISFKFNWHDLPINSYDPCDDLDNIVRLRKSQVKFYNKEIQIHRDRQSCILRFNGQVFNWLWVETNSRVHISRTLLIYETEVNYN